MIVTAVLAVLIAYLLGSVPTGYLIARRVKGIDIREVGGRYTGAKNVFDQVGVVAGIATAAIDAAKGAAAILITNALPVPEVTLVFSALAVVVGHIWPVWLEFRGGAGFATVLGVVIAALPRESFILLIPSVLLVLTLGSRLGLGVLSGLLAFPFLLLCWYFGEPPHLFAIPIIVGVLVAVRVYRRQIGEALQRVFARQGRK